jgi:ankyrin repeat protein
LLKHAKIDLKANDYEVFALAAASVKSNGSYSDYSIIDRLLKQPNIDRSKALFVVLQAAIDTDEFDLFSRVLNDKRFRLPTDNRPLCSAAAKGHVKMLKLLLDDKRFNPAANDNEALMAAVKAGQIESVEILLNDRRVNPAANGNEALRLAASRGSAAIVQLLLLYGVNPAADSNQAVLLAAKNGHTAILDLLLNYRQVDFRVINPSAVSPKTREWLRLHNDELKQRQTENRAFKQ